MRKLPQTLVRVSLGLYQGFVCTMFTNISDLGGGFKYFLFSPLPGEMIQFDYHFSKGLKPPTSD